MCHHGFRAAAFAGGVEDFEPHVVGPLAVLSRTVFSDDGGELTYVATSALSAALAHGHTERSTAQIAS